MDLTLPAEKVHEVVDVAIAHTNATVSELRRLFLVEDFLDSLKFGVLMWCLTSVGSWFNGMTLIIIGKIIPSMRAYIPTWIWLSQRIRALFIPGVVALFTLPKIYETNQEQIDQNLALVQAKINEITAKWVEKFPLTILYFNLVFFKNKSIGLGWKQPSLSARRPNQRKRNKENVVRAIVQRTAGTESRNRNY